MSKCSYVKVQKLSAQYFITILLYCYQTWSSGCSYLGFFSDLMVKSQGQTAGDEYKYIYIDSHIQYIYNDLFILKD